MGDKKYKNYCIIVLGRVNGVVDEISEVSEFDVNFLEHTNAVVATFSASINIKEIKAHFDSHNRGYFLFELGINNYAVNVGRKSIYNTLFKKFENGGDLTDDIGTKEFLEKLKGKDLAQILEFTDATIVEDGDEEIDIDSLTNEERKNMINEIIDKGVENFTKEDKELLIKLTNYDN